VSPNCPEFRARFAAYADETLTPLERGAVREHLALCGPCREEAAATDATLLFAAGGPPAEVSAADMARILQGVRAGVAIKRAERRLARPPRRAAAVAAAAAVALFTLALPGWPERDARDAEARGARGVRLAEPAAAAVTPTARFGLAKAAGAPADVEGATVYEIAPGAGPNEPRVVWIVDRSLDI
jgi:Putative zinc-finger